MDAVAEVSPEQRAMCGSAAFVEDHPMRYAILLAFGLQMALTAAAGAACQGQTGAVIFEDTFSDDSGGWDMTPGVFDIKPPHAVITLSKQSTNIQSQNLTFNATDADYCMEFTMPEQPAPDNTAAAGLEFWATDYNNLYMAQVFTSKVIGIYKRTAGNWNNIFILRDSPLIKIGPNEVNSIRVVAKNSRLALFVNGTQVKEIRAQTPPGNLRFGVYAQVDKAPDAPAVFNVSSFKVSAAP